MLVVSAAYVLVLVHRCPCHANIAACRANVSYAEITKLQYVLLPLRLPYVVLYTYFSLQEQE